MKKGQLDLVVEAMVNRYVGEPGDPELIELPDMDFDQQRRWLSLTDKLTVSLSDVVPEAIRDWIAAHPEDPRVKVLEVLAVLK